MIGNIREQIIKQGINGWKSSDKKSENSDLSISYSQGDSDYSFNHRFAPIIEKSNAELARLFGGFTINI